MPDDPESPNPNTPNGQNGPDNPSPLQGMFDRMNKKPKPPQRDYDAEVIAQAETLQLSPEQELIGVSAQKLAGLANEIVALANPEKTSVKNHVYVTNHTENNGVTITVDYIPEITPIGNIHAGARLIYHPLPLNPQYNSKTDTQYSLRVSIHSDKSTQEELDKLKKENPESAQHAGTWYHFDENGKFFKLSVNPVEIPDSRPHSSANRLMRFVESEITPDDFEIASSALIAIRDKLLPQTPQTPEP